MEILDKFNLTTPYKEENKIRIKSISKQSKSQTIKNRVIMKDGKLNI